MLANWERHSARSQSIQKDVLPACSLHLMLCMEKVLDIRGLSRKWESMSWEHNRGGGSFCSPGMCLNEKRVMDLKRSISRRPRGVGDNDPLYELKRGFVAAELEGNLGGGAENFLWK